MSTSDPNPAPPSSPHDETQRQINLKALQAAGYRPFGGAFAASGTLGEIRGRFQEGLAVRAAGRLMAVRHMGKSLFADLRADGERFQIFAGKSQTRDYDLFKMLDTGDHVGIEGELFTTRAGEQTVRVHAWSLLAKSLKPMPEKWHGLKDVETRYRQRYLDLIANARSRKLFDLRFRIIREIRSFFWERGFTEVETPMMQPQPGGALARPFKTHYAALAADMYLRIAPELYLKRLLVGGYEKIFELNRNFRNEGLSRNHNPEFTMLEAYQAYSDRKGMQALVQDLICSVAAKVVGTLRVGSEEQPVNLEPLPSGKWPEKKYRELIAEKMGADWYALSAAEAAPRAEKEGLAIAPAWSHAQITHEVYEKIIERTLVNPVFVTNLPRALVPLAKVCEDNPDEVDVFELVIGGREIAPGYSELNDPREQRERFSDQAGEDAPKTDDDFLLSLEHGMPPAGGLGLGVDRLVMVLTGAETIRDVILFPQLRQKSEPSDTASDNGLH
ncbi:MAG: lysine--tRNA ligase [Kiritimatiellae bacterium]|nr:lysine--tRNA ligase [Kiritimatiellia bacterium]